MKRDYWHRPTWWIKGFQCEQDYLDHSNDQQFFDFIDVPEL